MSIQWSLVLFTWLTGAGGCLFAFIGLNELTRWSKKSTFTASLVALVLSVVGGLASVTHLAHPDRMLNALTHPTSGIFVEAVLVAILCVCIIAYLICIRRKTQAAAKVFGVLGAIAGLLLSFMAGHSYIMAAQTAWATMALPLGYLATALGIGAGLWWALLASDKENGAQVASICAIACSVLALVCVLSYSVIAGCFTTSGTIAIAALICEAIAVILAVVARMKSMPGLEWGYVVVVAIAALLFRVLMWTVGGASMAFF